MSTLIIDGHNFLHRARAGFVKGEFSIVFNCLRNLRALVEQFQKSHNVNRVIFVLEGHPQHRYNLYSEYKANRRVVEGTKHHAEMIDFHRQKKLIVDLLEKYFPVSVMRHPEFECDDVIYNVINNASRSTQFIVVSNDSDFIQLLNKFDNVLLYNPMKKEFVDNVPYDYVAWKSIVGDGSDNIPGLATGVGTKTAIDLLNDETNLKDFLSIDDRQEKFIRNYNLIQFATFDDAQLLCVTSSSPRYDWDLVKEKFVEWRFNSLLQEKSWNKFIETFNTLWCKNV